MCVCVCVCVCVRACVRVCACVRVSCIHSEVQRVNSKVVIKILTHAFSKLLHQHITRNLNRSINIHRKGSSLDTH